MRPCTPWFSFRVGFPLRARDWLQRGRARRVLQRCSEVELGPKETQQAEALRLDDLARLPARAVDMGPIVYDENMRDVAKAQRIRDGRTIFEQLGCASCPVPTLELRHPMLSDVWIERRRHSTSTSRSTASHLSPRLRGAG